MSTTSSDGTTDDHLSLKSLTATVSTLRIDAGVRPRMEPALIGFMGFVSGVIATMSWMAALEYVHGIDGVMTRVIAGE